MISNGCERAWMKWPLKGWKWINILHIFSCLRQCLCYVTSLNNRKKRFQGKGCPSVLFALCSHKHQWYGREALWPWIVGMKGFFGRREQQHGSFSSAVSRDTSHRDERMEWRQQATRESRGGGVGELLSDPGARQLASHVPKLLSFLFCLPSLWEIGMLIINS